MHIQFNRLGVKGVVFGVAAGVIADGLAKISGAPLVVPWASIGIVTGGFASAVYGLLVDRCDRPGLWRSYWVNFAQFAHEEYGNVHPKYGCNPNRRLAFFGAPLAAFPLVVWFCVAMIWTLQCHDNLRPDRAAFTECLTAATNSIFFTWVIARATRRRRLIEPVEAEPPRPNIQEALAVQAFLDGQTPAPGLRWFFAATLVAGLSVTLLALSPVFDEANAMLLGLLGPLAMAIGLGGLIDPRLNLALQPGEYVCPRKLRILASTVIAVGFIGEVGLAAFVLLR